MAGRQYYIAMEEDECQKIAVVEPKETRLILTCGIHRCVCTRWVKWERAVRLRLSGTLRFPCGHGYNISEVHPTTLGDPKLVAQLRAIGDFSISLIRFDVDSVLKGVILGEDVKIRTNERGCWRQKKHQHQQMKTRYMFASHTVDATSSPESEKFSGYDMDKSSTSEASSLNDDGSRAAFPFDDETFNSVMAADHVEDSDDWRKVVMDQELKDPTRPFVRGLGLRIIAL